MSLLRLASVRKNRVWTQALDAIVARGSCRQFRWTTPHLSHIGQAPIPLPQSIDCSVLGDVPQTVHLVQSSGSRRSIAMPPGISAELQSCRTTSEDSVPSQSNVLRISCKDPLSRSQRSLWGLTRTQTMNAIRGLSEGYTTSVKLVGVGFRAAVEELDSASQSPPASTTNQTLVIRLGFPRPVRLEVPDGITAVVSTPTEIQLKGTDKEALGQFGARIRRWRPPEPYNGKGVFVNGEHVRRKEVRKK